MDECLADGVIRKLWIGEAADYRDHLLRLDVESRRCRFGLAIADAVIEAYVAAPTWSGAVLHGFLVDGVLRGVAELKPFGTALPTEAEAAFSVETPWQSHGVGSVLLARTLLAARNRGIRRVHMACLADNARMQQLARKFAVQLSLEVGGVAGEVVAPHPTPLSVLRELVADGHGVAAAMLDAQARLLKIA